MIDHLAEVLCIPPTFVRFAVGAGAGQAYFRYVSNIDADWSQRSEVTVTLHSSRPIFPTIRSEVYGGSAEITGSSEKIYAALAKQREVLLGRLSLFGLSSNIKDTKIVEKDLDGIRTFKFQLDVLGDPVFGRFYESRQYHLIDREPSILIGVRVRDRGQYGKSLGHSIAGDRLKALQIDKIFESDHEERVDASPYLLRMEAEDIPVHEISSSIAASVGANIRETLPEINPIGHLIGRSNIVLWYCLISDDATIPSSMNLWCDEIARLSLELPDYWFRHFVGASILTRNALAFGKAAANPSESEIESLTHYAKVLRRLAETSEPDPTQNELSTLILWLLRALENVADIGLCRQLCQLVSEVNGETLALTAAVDEAIEKSAIFARKRGDNAASALLGIRRCELAAAVLQSAASRGRFDAGGNSIHNALFGKLHQYNFHYQGILYGLDEDGVNSGLARAAQGMPPGILYLRPLSTLRSVYVPASDPTEKDGGLQTLEAALTSAIVPLQQATNAVGGLADILGMQRSDTVGEGDLIWQLLVSTNMEISGAIMVLPDQSEGVTWEIEQLVSNKRLSKCVFILLPKNMDWSDNGNRRGLEKAFKLSKEGMNPGGGFFFGDPVNNDFLAWEAIWDGRLTKKVLEIIERSLSVRSADADGGLT